MSSEKPGASAVQPIPVRPVRETGIGLRSQHYKDILELKPGIGWIEVHPENYFGGGTNRHYLGKAREMYPLSLHAVGLSLGSDQPVDKDHLRQIRELIDIYEPFQVSDHLAWSASGNAHMNDLLPLPYTEETLARFCENVDYVQSYLGRRILVENPTSYVAFATNEMAEYEFLNETVKKTGCGILLDVNNVYVQAYNHGYETTGYIDGIDADAVEEIHLAGPVERDFAGGTLLVDIHGRYVLPDVWDLYEYAIKRLGAVATMIEWDCDLPELSELVGEANKAQDIIDKHAKGIENAA